VQKIITALLIFIFSALTPVQASQTEIFTKAVFHIDANNTPMLELQNSRIVSCKSSIGNGIAKSCDIESSPMYTHDKEKAAFSFDGQNDFLVIDLPNELRLGSIHIFVAGNLRKAKTTQYFVGSKPDARLDLFANNKEFLVELGFEAHSLKHGPLLDEKPHLFELSHFLPEKVTGQIPPAHYFVDGNICGRPFSKSIEIITKTLTFGAHNSGSAGHLNGNIYEIIIFDKPLTECEQNFVRSYLGNKWNININEPSANNNSVKLKETRVGPDGQYSSIGIYNECPESPDGKRILYVIFDKAPSNDQPLAPFSLWVCDSNLQNHKLVQKSENPTDNHNAAFQQWVDNDSVAYCSSYIAKLPDGSYHKREIRVFNVDTGKVEFGPYTDGFLGDSTAKGKILMNVDGDQSNLGPRGVYELDTKTGNVRCVCKARDFGWYAENLDWYGMKKNCKRWDPTHARFSPEGTRISFMFNAGGSQYLFFTCNADGSNLKYWGADKPLHELWFDENTICGADEITDDNNPDNLSFRRWDLNKRVIETLAGQVNHTAFSPDRQWFAGESFYRSNPVELYIYKRGQTIATATVFQSDAQIVWQKVGHVNPSFSRDGSRLYYNRPVGDLKQAYFCDISSLVKK